MTTSSTTVPVAKSDLPQEPALAEAAKLIAEVTRNEETRFNNLNSRAIAVLSATSLITALAGIFSKDVLGDAYTGWERRIGAGGLVLTVLALVLTAGVVVIGVLKPGRRSVFGANLVTDKPAELTAAADVNRVAFEEYRAIWASLVERNIAKARYLNWAYLCFLAAVGIIAVTTALVVILRY